MISFKELGNQGRFGNQMFQYAFLRTTAERLGVPFYCPEWLGDHVFMLEDEEVRGKELPQTDKVYVEPENYCGFNQSALAIEDGTDILGFFQSEKCFDKEKTRAWFAFREEKVASVKAKYSHIDFSDSVGIHLRFGDMATNLKYVIVPPEYFKKALTKVKHRKHVLVFSDEIDTAKGHFKGLDQNFIYINDNENYEDLYLMTLCHDFICSVSTLCWWGAWLNLYPDKTIVVPKEWLRPGQLIKIHDLSCKGWISLRTCRFLLDDFRFVTRWPIWKQRWEKTKACGLGENWFRIKRYIKNKIKRTDE